MSVERYLRAATRENTRKSYSDAVRHFEVTWGGMLPTTSNKLVEYLNHYATKQTYSTLKLRMAALSRWHKDQGFYDPTKSPAVRDVLKGIRVEHPYQKKKAPPLTIEQLIQVDTWYEQSIQRARHQGSPDLGKLLRDRALIMLGFWRALRSDDLCRISLEFMTIPRRGDLTIYLPRSKGDRQAVGRKLVVHRVPQCCCPVTACLEWIDYLDERKGPLFRGFDRWGNPRSTVMNPKSIIPLLRKALGNAGIENPDSYTSHSLRRGFANWAIDGVMDIRSMMAYVGWNDINTAMEYVDAKPPSFEEAMDRTLGNRGQLTRKDDPLQLSKNGKHSE